jgi:heme oxygenase
MYRFPMRPKHFKDRYRARLDALQLGPDAVRRAVDEVKIAFGLNQAVFDELSANLPGYQQ